jgi:phosphoglycerate dehydrogenase-like enzyme
MKVGINGMGRIGRLALRAAMGAIERPTAWRWYTSMSSRAVRRPRPIC